MAVVGYDNLVTELGYTGSVVLTNGDTALGSIVVQDAATGEYVLAAGAVDGTAKVGITLEDRSGAAPGTNVPVAWGGIFKAGAVVQGGANINDPAQEAAFQTLGFIFRHVL
jgi:hypothetical protein